MMNLVIAICFQVLDHDSSAFQMRSCIIFLPLVLFVFWVATATASHTAIFSVLSVVVNLIDKHLSTYCVSGTVLDSGDTEMN